MGNCSHEKHGVTYDSYRLTRTVCSGVDKEGSVIVEVCDFCKTFIVTIKKYDKIIDVVEIKNGDLNGH